MSVELEPHSGPILEWAPMATDVAENLIATNYRNLVKITPLKFIYWDRVRPATVIQFAAQHLLKAQVTANTKIAKEYDLELGKGKKALTVGDLFSGFDEIIKVVIIDTSITNVDRQYKTQAQTIFSFNGVNRVFLGDPWMGSPDGDGNLKPQPGSVPEDPNDSSIALPATLFKLNPTRKDCQDLATLLVHELYHWVDAYSDHKANDTRGEMGQIVENMVDDGIYEREWKQNSDLQYVRKG